MKNIIIAVFVVFLAIGCSSQKTTTSTDERRPQQGWPPSYSELLAEMDANKDGKLSKSEVEGPLQNDFSKIDSDGDGFITITELEHAPKPQRGQRPPKN